MSSIMNAQPSRALDRAVHMLIDRLSHLQSPMRLFSSDSRAGSQTDAGDRAPRNRILAALPLEERTILDPLLEPLVFERRKLLYDPERVIQYVWFVEEGIISILSVLGDGSAVETLTIGHDGMVGMPIFNGVELTAEQGMVQAPGHGFRIPARVFRAALPQLPTLSMLLHRFSAFSFTTVAQNSACNRKHAVEQRCARWLLTVHDRTVGDQLHLTHDFISQMLGVRRASVTDTLASLERQGLVATGRNRITVADRSGLEGVVCECYRIIAASYDRLLGSGAIVSPLVDVATSKGGYSTVGDGTPIASSTDGLATVESAS
jgi:CRP-like cAMP-binding protein